MQIKPQDKLLGPAAMPPEVSLMYIIAKKISDIISDNIPKIDGDFKNANVTIAFDNKGSIIHICNNRAVGEYETEESEFPEYYDELKYIVHKNYTPLFISNKGKFLQLKDLQMKDGKPISANIQTAQGEESYKIRYKNGLMSRFECSTNVNKDKKIIQILNFENQRPTHYIRLISPIQGASEPSLQGNITWAKFYDLDGNIWRATPPDGTYKEENIKYNPD